MIESPSAAGSGGPRAAVIGSGFGGLAAAIRLQSAGFPTVVFEARDKPGGRAYVYEQDGFVFDGGPTVITAPTCLEELFTLSGRKLADYVELIPVSPLYRLIWSDGDRMDYVASEDAMAEQIRQRNPADVEGFRRFVAYTSEVFHKGYQGLAATPFLRFTDMVRVAPQLIKLRADRSVYATVARYVQDEHVRQALSFHSLLVTQSAWFRPHNRDPSIPGLYLVGAGTHPGAGVPGVINSAKATAEIVLRDFGRSARVP